MRNKRDDNGSDSPRSNEQEQEQKNGFFGIIDKIIKSIGKVVSFFNSLKQNISKFFTSDNKPGALEKTTTPQEEKKETVNISLKEPSESSKKIKDPALHAMVEGAKTKFRSRREIKAEMPKAERTTAPESKTSALGRAARS